MHDDTERAPVALDTPQRWRHNLAICPNCGGEVKRKSERGPFPTFCSDECRKEKGNRDLTRGSVIVGYAQTWRRNRGVGGLAKSAFAELCSIVDRFNDEDRKAGRPFADLHVAKLIDSGYLYIDRAKNWGTRKPAHELRAANAFTPAELEIIAARFASDNDPDCLAIAAKAAKVARIEK
jgi:hypothetical protein